MKHPEVRRRVTLAAALGAAVVCGVALSQWRAIAIQVHLLRFRQDSRCFVAAAAGAEGTVARSAVTAFLATRTGKETLRRCFIEEVLSQCLPAVFESRGQPGLEMDQQIDVELYTRERNGVPDYVFALMESDHRSSTDGSRFFRPVPDTGRLSPLLRLLECGKVEEWLTPPDHPGHAFALLLSGDFCTVSVWRPRPVQDLSEEVRSGNPDSACRALCDLRDLGPAASAAIPTLEQARTREWPGLDPQNLWASEVQETLRRVRGLE